MKYGQDIAFETFLEKLKLAEDQYLKDHQILFDAPNIVP